MKFENYIATVEGFPKEGISFKDITPLMQNGEAFKNACQDLARFAKEVNATIIVGPESRGFIFGCPVAYELGLGFVPIRKPGKLPREHITEKYDLEYGSNSLCMHVDAIKPGDKVVIIDDLLATGGTVLATVNLIKRLGGEVVGACFLIELGELNGRKLLEEANINIYSIMNL